MGEPDRCRLCRNTTNNSVFHAREMMFGTREAFDYFQCGLCQCLQIQNFPDDMTPYYPQAYYSFRPGPKTSWKMRVKQTIRRWRDTAAAGQPHLLGRLLASRYSASALIQQWGTLQVNRRAAILDAGCGNAELLRSLYSIGYHHLLGIDPYGHDQEIAPGFRVKKSVIEDLAIGSSEKWDVIMFHHCLEHVQNPLTALQSARRLLAPGGRCWVRIPIVSSWAWKEYGTDWMQIDPPRHFYLHSLKSIKALVEEAGLTLLSMVFDSDEGQFIGSEQYRRNIPLNAPQSYYSNPAQSVFTPSQIETFKARARQLNASGEGDQISMILTSRG